MKPTIGTGRIDAIPTIILTTITVAKASLDKARLFAGRYSSDMRIRKVMAKTWFSANRT